MIDGAGSNGRGLKTLMVFACIVVIVAGMIAAQAVLRPVLVAMFLSIISLPPVIWFKKRGAPDWMAVSIVFIGVIVIFGMVSAYVGTSVQSLLANLGSIETNLKSKLDPLIQWVQGLGIDLPIGQSEVEGAIEKEDAQQQEQWLPNNWLISWARGGMLAILNILSNTFLILLMVVFIMMEATTIPRKIRAAINKPDDDLGRFTAILSDLQAYLAVKTQLSILTGVVVAIGLWILGVDYFILWGLLAFLLNYIPTIGSIIAAVPPTLFALLEFGWNRAIIVIIIYLVVNTVIGNILEPRMMGRRLGLSTLVVFISMVFWGWVWGPIGMILSVPLTMVLKILLDNSDDLKWMGVMLGSAPDARPENNGD